MNKKNDNTKVVIPEASPEVTLASLIDGKLSNNSGAEKRQAEIAKLEAQLPALESMPEVAGLVQTKIKALSAEIASLKDLPVEAKRQGVLSDLFSALPGGFFGESITNLTFTKSEGNGWLLKTRKAAGIKGNGSDFFQTYGITAAKVCEKHGFVVNGDSAVRVLGRKSAELGKMVEVLVSEAR